jgi:hypothetical protein
MAPCAIWKAERGNADAAMRRALSDCTKPSCLDDVLFGHLAIGENQSVVSEACPTTAANASDVPRSLMRGRHAGKVTSPVRTITTAHYRICRG